eukprot:CFRG0924T1
MATYFVAAWLMLWVNNLLFAHEHDLEKVTLFMTWFQCASSLGTFYIAGRTGFGPPFSIDSIVLRSIMPLSVIFVLMLLANNWCLRYGEDTFYYVTRSWTVVWTVFLSFFLLDDVTTVTGLISCALVVFGFLLGNTQEVIVSFNGAFIGLLSSICVSLYGIYIGKMLPTVGNSGWRLMLHNAMNVTIFFFPVLLLNGQVFELFSVPQAYTISFWLRLLLNGLLGGVVAVAISDVIRVTSPLTYTLSNMAKFAVQSIVVYLFSDRPMLFLDWVSAGFILLGTFIYATDRGAAMSYRNSHPISSSDDGIVTRSSPMQIRP